MKYKSIELQNYAGIYNGMKLNQIKVDLTKCKTNKILIRGDNGSGKSTLMNAINVNPDTNDKFIPNTEARKTIVLVDNGIEYVIRYIHPVTGTGNRGTTKGYVSKSINGIMTELNPNGNISSCRDIIYEEFCLDANFMTLSQLSSEDRGLVDRKPAERKKLINSIISILDVYNNIYKILNKKSAIFSSTVNSLTYKIQQLGDETSLQLNLKSIESRIDDLENKKNGLIEAIASIKVKISEYINILQQNNYDTVVSELDMVSKNNKITLSYINKTLKEFNIDDYLKVGEFLNYLRDKYIKLESDIDSDRKQIPLLLAQRESECSDLENKNTKLNSLQSEYNYLEVKKAKENAERLISEYDVIFNKMGLMNINLITKSEFDSAMEALDYLKKCANALVSNYSIDSIKYVYANIDMIKTKARSIKSDKFVLDGMEIELSDLNKKLYIFEANRKIASELNNRPKECKVDSCPYIKSAIEADNMFPEGKYIELIQEINALQNKIKDQKNYIDTLEEQYEIAKQIDLINRELKSKMRFILKLPVRKDFEESFMIRVIEGDRFLDIDNLYQYIDCGNMIEEYKVAKQNLHNFEVEYKIYESKNNVIESILSDIESLNIKINDLSNKIEVINNTISEKEKELLSIKSCKDKIELLYKKITEEYNPSVEREGELLTIKNSLENNNLEINKLQSKVAELNTSLGSMNIEIKNATNERDKLKHSAQLLNEYRAELDVYMKKYTKIKEIKYYASPNTGIQTVFMELYMNKIIAIANDLLSLLFEGEFTLQPFIINENEFRIPCIGNGLMHDDISSMSTAQKCMISMILSFSLLYQSSTKYNIIKLDELDAFLDTNNRGYFITLLDRLMDLLKCEQCFIVSHNNELASYNCDIILLKNSNYVATGTENIIWQY